MKKLNRRQIRKFILESMHSDMSQEAMAPNRFLSTPNTEQYIDTLTDLLEEAFAVMIGGPELPITEPAPFAIQFDIPLTRRAVPDAAGVVGDVDERFTVTVYGNAYLEVNGRQSKYTGNPEVDAQSIKDDIMSLIS